MGPVSPGKKAVKAFTTRTPGIPAGEVAVTATSASGPALTTELVAAYGAKSCG